MDRYINRWMDGWMDRAGRACATARLRTLRRNVTECSSLAYTRYSFPFCVCARIIIHLLPRPIRTTLTTAIPLRDFCAIYVPPPTLPLYAIHHAILVMTISCKGKVAARVWFRRIPDSLDKTGGWVGVSS